MRAIIASQNGIHPAEIPEPSAGATDVIVAVDAFSINRGETFQLEQPRAGWRPGKDIAGTVVTAAADGSGPPVGTRVVGHPPSAGWAERAAVPVARLAVLPDSVDSITAASLPLAGLTALRLLRVAGPLAGQRILITGASGGVGHLLVELAAAQGARITAVSRRGNRLEASGAEVVSDIADLTGTFDVIFESVGGDALSEALRHLEPHGRLIWFGQAGREPSTLDFFDFFDGPEGASLEHFHYESAPGTYADDLATLVRLVAGDRLHPYISMINNWGDTAQVIGDLIHRRISGKAVLTLRPDLRVPTPRQVIERYVAAIQAGDVDTLRASFQPDAVWRIPGNGPLSGDWVGPEGIIDDFLGRASAPFSPADPPQLTLQGIVDSGPTVIAEWRTTGTARNGLDYDNQYAVAFEVTGGRIAGAREYLDTAHFHHLFEPAQEDDAHPVAASSR